MLCPANSSETLWLELCKTLKELCARSLNVLGYSGFWLDHLLLLSSIEILGFDNAGVEGLVGLILKECPALY